MPPPAGHERAGAGPDERAVVTVPVIGGPTAAGKTALAIDLALRVGGVEIVSADSRQVYIGMDVGTAKPTIEERRGVPHHLIDIVAPDRLFSAGEFAERAATAIDAIRARGNMPLVVGGSGFYVRALFEGLGAPTVEQELLKRLTERGEREGYDVLHRELAAVDPVAAAAHSPNNHVKTLRALCCYHQTGRPYSSFLADAPATAPRFSPRHLVLVPPRAELYDRINRRTIAMLEAGFVEEVRRLLEEGYGGGSPGLRTVGYTEVLAHLAGTITYERMLELIRQGTRRFAKRQMTWYRNQTGAETMETPDLEAAMRWMGALSVER